MRRVFVNAMITTSKGIRRGAVAVRDGVIDAVGDVTLAEDDVVTDCGGRCLMAGLVDVHVHLREPGYEYKETIASGTAAAAHGGYTTVCSMPNLRPAPDCRASLDMQREAIARTASIEVIPYASITEGQRGEGSLVDFKELAGDVIGFSDDGKGVQRGELMREAMQQAVAVSRPIVAHCEVDELLRGGYIHDGDYCRRNNHRGISSESEWAQVVRDIELAAEVGCQYHVCHVSTRESVEAIRAGKARGVRVTCETAPHYLLLTDEDLREEGRFKMNPPLRSSADQQALLQGIKDGTIEVIATDHAPHSSEEKSRGLEGSAMGIVGIETAFALLYTYLVERGVISLAQLTALMAENPRRIFGIKGGLEVGDRADIAIFDLDKEYVIDPERFLSKGRATPFEGWRVKGECLLTMAAGRVAYSNGTLEEK